MNNSPVIEIENITFCYPGNTVLKNVSFSVFPGEFIGMIGPNGGGKTTLLKLILGFLKPLEGSVKVFAETAGSSQASQQLAYVPQAVRFDREFPISVEEVILSGLISHLPWYGRFCASDRQAASDALAKVGLTHLSKASFGTLSGGQAQRVLIARAMVSNPKLILLDEPTASVDSQAEADIYTLLSDLKGHTTILMVTHDLGVAIEQVQRILCVQGGVMSLRPEEVCKHFAFGLYHMPLIQPRQSQL
jgi:zinc transport system ATP-binding protein